MGRRYGMKSSRVFINEKGNLHGTIVIRNGLIKITKRT